MDTNTNQLATKIAAEIGRSELSLNAIAAKAGIPRTTLKNRLSGRTDFTVREVGLLAEALRTTPSKLIPTEIMEGKAAA